MKKLLIATSNPGKFLEYKIIFKDLPIRLLNLKDLNIDTSPNEDGKTFQENAVKKVKFYSKFVEFPVLAEDSGLEIDCLNGEPGVKSRRWPGYEASDQELIDLTLEKLKGIPFEKRGAQLRVAIALIIKKEIKLFEGTLRGIIMEKPVQAIIPGYPFRSLFFIPEINKVLGELTMEGEAAIAHRRKALEESLPMIKELLC